MEGCCKLRFNLQQSLPLLIFYNSIAFFNSSTLFNLSQGVSISVLPICPNAAKSWYLNFPSLNSRAFSIPFGDKSNIFKIASDILFSSTFEVPKVSTFIDTGLETPIA